MTEQEIRRYLRQMREEDSQIALRKFHQLCYDRFFRIAYYYLHSEEWTEEVVLDIFMKIWERRETLDNIENLEDYFFITVKNAALTYLQKELRYNELNHGTTCSVTGNSDEHSPEEILISEELFSHYVKALDRLPERCREIFIRIREEKQSYTWVAEEMNISVNTVNVQLQKAIARLREMLAHYISE